MQMVEGRTSVQMDKAEASQKALRAELNKLKETANATQASQMEAESKKVKYLQSELEKVRTMGAKPALQASQLCPLSNWGTLAACC